MKLPMFFSASMMTASLLSAGSVAADTPAGDKTDHVYFGPALSVQRLDVSTRKADTLGAGELFVGVPVWREILAVEVGARGYEEWKSKGADAVGTFETRVSTRDYRLGLKFYVVDPDVNFPVFVQSGVTRSVVDLKVDESFYGTRPDGSARKTSWVTGFYAGVGVDWLRTRHIDLFSSVEYTQRDNVFPESRKKFSLTNVGLLTGFRAKF